jgi:hypothetical protein
MLFKDVENMARLQEDIVKTFKSMMIENEVCQCLTSYTQYNDSGSILRWHHQIRAIQEKGEDS